MDLESAKRITTFFDFAALWPHRMWEPSLSYNLEKDGPERLWMEQNFG